MDRSYPLSHFLDATFRFLQPTLGARRVAFYRVDENYDLYDFVRVDMPDAFGMRYGADMASIDPLHVRRIGAGDGGVSCLDTASASMGSEDALSYRGFLNEFGIADTVELIFRSKSAVRAGISVFWGGDETRSNVDRDLLKRIHSYVQFNIERYLVSDDDRIVQATKALGLTTREAEIVELVTYGRTNQEIATCLGVSTATVKTHLIHTFDKVGTATRTELVALWLRHRNGDQVEN